MSVIQDFSFNNPLIRDYFEGQGHYAPVPELMYIHSHPLIHPNFLSDIEALVNHTAQVLEEKNMKSGPVNRFVHLAQSLGKLLPILSESNASEALIVLREIYQFCRKLTK